ncbi:cell division protein ZapA [Streptococcus pluranimalium]
MTKKNRYKFIFGDRPLTLTTDKDNLFMEEVERIAKEKYDAIREKLPEADNETLAILLAINALSTQLSREMAIADIETELAQLKQEPVDKDSADPKAEEQV